MKTERFNDRVKEIRESSLGTLTKKNANYATESVAPNISQSRDWYNSIGGNEYLNQCGGELEG